MGGLQYVTNFIPRKFWENKINQLREIILLQIVVFYQYSYDDTLMMNARATEMCV